MKIRTRVTVYVARMTTAFVSTPPVEASMRSWFSYYLPKIPSLQRPRSPLLRGWIGTIPRQDHRVLTNPYLTPGVETRRGLQHLWLGVLSLSDTP